MAEMIRARILKGVGGFYTVMDDKGNSYTIKAGGKLRNEDVTPLPGDMVEFEYEPGEINGAISTVLDRRNLLVRPRVANMNLVFAVVSAKRPNPDWMLLDKLCANAMMNDMQAVAVMNKCELASEQDREAFLQDYAAFSATCVSAKSGQGVEDIRTLAEGKLCCFAGQSGVGKSSIINILIPESNMETGQVSKKTNRGKHTTRHAELMAMQGGGALMDTPGFSLMELPTMEPDALQRYYPEFEPYLGKCRFATCLHESEPDCAVIAAVDEKSIPLARWERYVAILQQIKQQWRNRYE